MATNDETSHDTKAAPTPIFILGILPRCGTAFLFDLLQLHPACGRAVHVWEDYFLFHADQLVSYLDAVRKHWNPRYASEPAVAAHLYEALGGGILSFLASHDANHRIVTKTPRVDNLPRFFKLFPKAHLLILIRDGRAVIESGIKTFGWQREWAIQRWAQAARTILNFESSARENGFKYRIVRYESLWESLESEMRGVLRFLELDADCYDFEAARRLPIRGSSTVREQSSGAMHWRPVEKTEAFDPMSRWRHWNRARHERFNWVAGPYLERLGYEPKVYESGGLAWGAWNRLYDLRWQIGVLLRPILGPFWQRLAARRRQRLRKGRA